MNILVTLILTIIGLLLVSFYKKNFERKDNFKGPWELPIFGSLLYISKCFHQDLTRWSKKYGKTFRMWMGDYYTVIVRDPVLIREIWLKNFDSFTDRPHLPSLRFMGTEFKDVSTADYHVWNHNKNIVAHAFTKTQLKNIGGKMNIQSARLLTKMNEFTKSGEVFYPKYFIRKYSLNVILSMFFSEELSYEENASGAIIEQLVHPVERMFAMAGRPNILDYSRALDTTAKHAMNLLLGNDLKSIQNFLTDLHKSHLKDIDPENPRDLLDQLISSKYLNEEDKDKNILGITTDVLVAGSDSSSYTIIWFFLFMCNNPEVQEKAFNELKDVVGLGNEVNLSHRINTPYTYAIIKEILRIKAIGPVGLPRVATQDIQIKEHYFRKGDLFFMNIYGLHHDEDYWEEPEKFIPERFIGNNHAEYYLPFGIGPRNCVGANLAIDSVYIAIANILLNFKLSSVDGKQIDESEIFGITLAPNPFGVQMESRV